MPENFDSQNVRELLLKTEEKCQSCYKCPLGKTRTKVVFSGGVPNNKLMLIGEAPGYWEDQKGEPFVGKAGQLLDKIFACVGLSRQKDVYICNTLKCRPPDNRNPLPEEKAACREYLDIQVGALKPKIILLCGNIAVQSFLEGARGITKVRGQWFDGPYGSKMMPIFHPSYLLRNDSREKGKPKVADVAGYQRDKKGSTIPYHSHTFVIPNIFKRNKTISSFVIKNPFDFYHDKSLNALH